MAPKDWAKKILLFPLRTPAAESDAPYGQAVMSARVVDHLLDPVVNWPVCVRCQIILLFRQQLKVYC